MQSVLLACPALQRSDRRAYVCKSCAVGGGCPTGCVTGGEWFCCLTSGGRAGCRFRCSECACPDCQTGPCHCFTDLPMPCQPRPHSGDQPCTCTSTAEPREPGACAEMDLAAVAQKLARRSSRRQFFKLLGAGSLGTGLFLTGTDVSLGAVTGCVSCGGGPCSRRWISPAQSHASWPSARRVASSSSCSGPGRSGPGSS